MASRTKPYEAFGPFILFKKLESDSLGDLWRAGRIDAGQLGPTVALRRLSGGNREAMVASANAAAQIVPQLTGTSFVRDQAISVTDNVPHLTWDYQGGRSLRYIVDRARGGNGNGNGANPIPIDQAIVIAEKVALSLATISDLRDGGGQRLWHGALLPQFVWISDDGEIRVAGQLLGAGLVASLGDPKVSGEIARYFAPEARGSAQPRNADVYSMGALLFLLVTGQEPPDAATASAFGAAVRAAKTMTGTPVPDDIRVILDKSFNIDPSMRYASMGEMKQALSALAHGGKYSATTFNLAFYLSNLLKKEMETEALDRDKESKVNVAPYLEAPRPAPAVADAPRTAPFASASAAEEPKKGKLGLVAAIVAVVLLGLGGGGWYMMQKPQPAAKQINAARAVPAPQPQQPRVLSEPITVAATPATATAPAPAATDSAAQQKAFEDAVKARMQAEMMKLQTQFEAELKKTQARNAPVTTPAAPAPAPASTPVRSDASELTAAQLDQQRRDAQPQRQEPAQTAAATPAPVQTQTTAPAPQVAQQQVAAPQPVPAAPAVREGDVVAATDLDQIPRPIKVVQPVYPPIARAQRVSALVIVSALVNENGQVTDVRVLRGEPRFGMNDAAVRAMKATRFSSPIKDGKRVKTWLPQQYDFKP